MHRPGLVELETQLADVDSHDRKRAFGAPVTASAATRLAKSGSTSLSVLLQPDELELLVSLAADQIFRREFIDPKMPGFKRDGAQLNKAKDVVSRLKAVLESGHKRSLTRMAGSQGGR